MRKPKQPDDCLKFSCPKCNEPLQEAMQQEGIVDPWLYYATATCFICNTWLFVTSYFNTKVAKIQDSEGKVVEKQCEWVKL